MTKTGYRFCAILAVGLGGVVSDAAAQDVRWRPDYATARKEATATGKPLLLDFGTENCVWCRRMDASTLRDPAVVRLLNERFIPVKIDGNQEERLTQALGVQAFPTFVVASADGKILGRNRGFADVPKMMALLEPAAESAPPPRAAVAAAPPPQPAIVQASAQEPVPDPLADAKADYAAGRFLTCLEKCQRAKESGGMVAADATGLIARITADPVAWQQVCRQIDDRLVALHPDLVTALPK